MTPAEEPLLTVVVIDSEGDARHASDSVASASIDAEDQIDIGVAGPEGVADRANARNARWVTILDAGDLFVSAWLPVVRESIATHPQIEALMIGGSLATDQQRTAVLQGSFVAGQLVVRRDVFVAIDAAVRSPDVDRTWAMLLRIVLDGGRIGLVDQPLVRRLPRPATPAQTIATLESVRSHPRLLASEKEMLDRAQRALGVEVRRGVHRTMPQVPESIDRGTGRDAPTVSVILPFFNETRFLDGAVETVRDQTISDWELLLVDDGSTDGSSEIAEGHARTDPERVTVVMHPGKANHGLPASRNLGLAHARGTFVAFVDADDRWAPEKLARQIAILETSPDVVMTCGAIWYGKVEGGAPPVRKPVTRRAPHTFGRGAFARALVRGRLLPPPPSDVMIRASTLRDVGGVPAGDNLYEDQRTFVAVSLHGPVHVSDEALTTYAVRDDSLYGSLRSDAATQRLQRRAFEAWIVSVGSRSGLTGLNLAATVIAHRAADGVSRRWRAALRRMRRRARR